MNVETMVGYYRLEPPETAPPETPTIVGSWRAVALCGCYCVVGRRTDDNEVATGFVPCCEDHFRMVAPAFNMQLAEAIETGDPGANLMDTIVTILDRVARPVI